LQTYIAAPMDLAKFLVWIFFVYKIIMILIYLIFLMCCESISS